jgi:hypothetical protein
MKRRAGARGGVRRAPVADPRAGERAQLRACLAARGHLRSKVVVRIG